MRSAALPLAGLLLLSTATGAQLTLTPQIGIDNSRTELNYNGGPSFAPLGRQTDPRASLRLDYRLKGGHGPFVGVASSPAPIDFSFAAPATGARDFKAGRADRQFRLEGGWQYSSKPITFRNRKAEAAAAQRARTRALEQSAEKSRCGSYRYKSSSMEDKMNKAVQQARSRAWNLRVQPFAGAAYVPSTEEDLATQNGTNTYKAGNWNTALLAGTGFEFGRGSQRLFTINVQYLKGLGNLDEKTLVTQSDAKTTLTRLQSDVSAWSVGLGLPFTLAKKKAATPTRSQSTKEKSKCGEYKEYRYRCTRKVVI
ncbi:MAG TPA: hypothetical protein VGE66_04975 [Chitinophagaceae bacterium]